MCGILGGWTLPSLAAPELESALETIQHRGPDAFGTFQDQETGIFLGMRRLAILDLSGGQQPIFNEDRSVCVVFNGEIYNYRELIPELVAQGHVFETQSDTEVLVHLWEEHGPGMCAFLRGMFAFAIWDARAKTLFIARDRFGKKPLYWTQPTPDSLLFGSELKGLRALAKATGAPAWRISPQAVYHYLSLGVVPQDDTVFEGVTTLPAGHWALFDGKTLKTERYWSLNFNDKTRLSYPEAQDHVRSLIRDAVRIRLRSDVPLGVFLSAGMDSSLVAYEAAQILGPKLQTFTIGVDDPRLDESPVAQRTAKALGVQNTVLRLDINPVEDLLFAVRHYDQPYSDSSALPSLAVSRLARQHVKVVLNGDGGDELFAGYRRYVAARWMGALSWVPRAIPAALADILGRLGLSRRSALGFIRRFAAGLSQGPGARYLSWTSDMFMDSDKRSVWRGAPGMLPTEDLVGGKIPWGLSGLDTQLATDHRVNLLSDLLVKMDMATMAASLEGRSPLMDHVVAEFAASLPAEYMIRGTTPKAILRDAWTGRLPDEVTHGAKRGFEIPLEAWIQGPFQPLIQECVLDSQARINDWLDPSAVRDIVEKKALTHRNHKYIVYALLVLELWLRDHEG